MSVTFKLNRVIIFTNDVTKLKIFYTGLFNLPVTEETPNEWVVLNTGGAELALHKIGISTNGDESSNTKLVFTVDTELAVLHDDLLAKGMALKEVKRFPGANYSVCDGEDPDGNVFQLMYNHAE
jgi:predicted enzyme related to lactoylglutathione lyase